MMMKGKHLKTSFLKLLLNSVELPQDLRCNVSSRAAQVESTQRTDAAPRGTPITTTASGVVEKLDTRLEMEITLK
jgi:hypothetical protein